MFLFGKNKIYRILTLRSNVHFLYEKVVASSATMLRLLPEFSNITSSVEVELFIYVHAKLGQFIGKFFSKLEYKAYQEYVIFFYQEKYADLMSDEELIKRYNFFHSDEINEEQKRMAIEEFISFLIDTNSQTFIPFESKKPHVAGAVTLIFVAQSIDNLHAILNEMYNQLRNSDLVLNVGREMFEGMNRKK